MYVITNNQTVGNGICNTTRCSYEYNPTFLVYQRTKRIPIWVYDLMSSSRVPISMNNCEFFTQTDITITIIIINLVLSLLDWIRR